ncbi:MAG: DUF971 domain-containing protein [archaeon]|nr:DUF971 domain-containing protein [archaeon]
MEGSPVLIRLERKKHDMVVTYDSGQSYTISYDDLRHACPCAKCSPMRNEDATSMELRREIEKFRSEKPSVKKVGNYALSFEWTRGCSSGIYRFERLWDLAQGNDPDRGKPYVHGAW